MKKAITIVLSLVLFAACTTQDKNSVFLWRYKTKSELYAAGFKPFKLNDVNVDTNVLATEIADTSVWYRFRNGRLTSEVISIKNADSAKIFIVLSSLGFVKKGDTIIIPGETLNFHISSTPFKTYYIFQQEYYRFPSRYIK